MHLPRRVRSRSPPRRALAQTAALPRTTSWRNRLSRASDEILFRTAKGLPGASSRSGDTRPLRRPFTVSAARLSRFTATVIQRLPRLGFWRELVTRVTSIVSGGIRHPPAARGGHWILEAR